jgi:hypothetical protein
MRISDAIFVLTSFLSANPALAQKQLAQSPRIPSAKSVYFCNETGSDAVGKNALAQLRKWGKFQLVADPKRREHHLCETGTKDDGHITEDPIPNCSMQSPTRYAHLAVIDSKTGRQFVE